MVVCEHAGRLINELSHLRCMHRPQFRSYKPLDEDLQKSTVAAAQPEEMDVDIKTTLDKASDPVVIDELVFVAGLFRY